MRTIDDIMFEHDRRMKALYDDHDKKMAAIKAEAKRRANKVFTICLLAAMVVVLAIIAVQFVKPAQGQQMVVQKVQDCRDQPTPDFRALCAWAQVEQPPVQPIKQPRGGAR